MEVLIDHPLIMTGVLAIAAGCVMLVVALAFTGEYTKGDPPKHRKPRDVIGERIQDTRSLRRHRKRDTQGPTTRLGTYFVSGRMRADGYYTEPTPRVRLAEKEGDVEEESSADSQRGEDPRAAVEDGEEGGENPQAAVTLKWFHEFVTDRYALLDSNGTLIRMYDADEYADDKGRIDRDLLLNGLPMIPDELPMYERGWL